MLFAHGAQPDAKMPASPARRALCGQIPTRPPCLKARQGEVGPYCRSAADGTDADRVFRPPMRRAEHRTARPAPRKTACVPWRRVRVSLETFHRASESLRRAQRCGASFIPPLSCQCPAASSASDHLARQCSSHHACEHTRGGEAHPGRSFSFGDGTLSFAGRGRGQTLIRDSRHPVSPRFKRNEKLRPSEPLTCSAPRLARHPHPAIAAHRPLL